MDTRADGPTVDGLGPQGALVGPGSVTLQIGAAPAARPWASTRSS